MTPRGTPDPYAAPRVATNTPTVIMLTPMSQQHPRGPQARLEQLDTTPRERPVAGEVEVPDRLADVVELMPDQARPIEWNGVAIAGFIHAGVVTIRGARVIYSRSCFQRLAGPDRTGREAEDPVGVI